MTGKQLKNSILQWAIQGKLVPQDPSDEPASVLLERIRAEKARLVKEKKIKKPKNESFIFRGDDNSHYEQFADGTVKCIDEEIPFEIPASWAWCRLGMVCTVFGRIGFRGYTKNDLVEKGKGAISISPSNMKDDGTMRLNNNTYISWHKYEESPEIKIFIGDILVVKTGSSYGKACLVESLPEKATINPQIAVLKFILCNREFLAVTLNASSSKKQFENYVLGTSIPTFSQEKLASTLIPIPPLCEQERILAKLGTLLPLCEKYDNSSTLLTDLIGTFNEKLKKSILQEAIQGKLVEQCSDDEPASELLNRIKTEKERLINEKKIKRDKAESVIFRGDDNSYYEQIGSEIRCIDDEIPFEIPDSWAWCRCATLFKIWSARRVHEKDWRSSGIPFYRAREIGKLADNGYINNDLFIDKTLYDEFSKNGVPKVGDLLVTAVGTLGKVYIIPDSQPIYFKDGSVICLSKYADLDSSYLKMAISTDMFVSQYANESQGTTVATLTMVRVNQYLLPIPPLAEQQRIADKIEQLFQQLK